MISDDYDKDTIDIYDVACRCVSALSFGSIVSAERVVVSRCGVVWCGVPLSE